MLHYVAVMLEGIYIPDVLISLFYLVQQARHLERLGWQTTHRASWQVLYIYYYIPIAYWSTPWLESSTLQLQLQQDSPPQTYRVSEISSQVCCHVIPTLPPAGSVECRALATDLVVEEHKEESVVFQGLLDIVIQNEEFLPITAKYALVTTRTHKSKGALMRSCYKHRY